MLIRCSSRPHPSGLPRLNSPACPRQDLPPHPPETPSEAPISSLQPRSHTRRRVGIDTSWLLKFPLLPLVCPPASRAEIRGTFALCTSLALVSCQSEWWGRPAVGVRSKSSRESVRVRAFAPLCDCVRRGASRAV